MKLIGKYVVLFGCSAILFLVGTSMIHPFVVVQALSLFGIYHGLKMFGQSYRLLREDLKDNAAADDTLKNDE